MNLLEVLRAHARRSLYEYDGRANRAIRTVFATYGPLPWLDVMGLAMAQELSRVLMLDPNRGRRLIAAAVEAGATPVAIIGDSHSSQLVRRLSAEDWWILPIHLLCTGASARGLGNPDAAARAGARIKAFLAELPPMQCAFMFGQVDVEFVHAFKRLAADETRFDETAFEIFCDQTVARYIAFLKATVPATLDDCVHLFRIFPPALSDSAWRRGYVNAHIAALHGPADLSGLERLEIPSLADRTRLHWTFNNKLADAALAAGFAIDGPYISLLTRHGVVRPRLRGLSGGRNHHLSYRAMRRSLQSVVSIAAYYPASFFIRKGTDVEPDTD